MLRALWGEKILDYQLVDIPTQLLKLMRVCTAVEVGRRTGRRSLGFDVLKGDMVLFHVHFDGADGKCQIRGLRIDQCIMIAEWQQPLVD